LALWDSSCKCALDITLIVIYVHFPYSRLLQVVLLQIQHSLGYFLLRFYFYLVAREVTLGVFEGGV